MKIDLHCFSYNQYGGLSKSLYSAVEFLEFRSPDFGSALSKIILNAHFHSSEPPRPTLEESYEDYHLRLADLPKSKFERKKQRLTIDFESKTGSVEYISDMKDAPNHCGVIVIHKDVRIDVFNAFLREILAIMRLVKGKTKTEDHKETFVWLSYTWMLKEQLSILNWAADNISLNAETTDWFEEFLCANPKHQDAGKLWETLLIKHKCPGVLRKASQWLLTYGDSENATDVASALLHECPDPPVVEKAKQLVWENPGNVFLISKVIELAGDEEIEQLGSTRLKTEDFIVAGMYLARPLLRRNSQKYLSTIESWLHDSSGEPHFVSILAELFTAAPAELAPFVFEWLDENPKIGNVEKIFQMVFILSPSQWLLDRTWTWISGHLSGRHTARMLNVVLSNASNEIICPEDACAIADAWLGEHIRHIDAKDLLLSALHIDATPGRLELAKKWLKYQKFDERGQILMALAGTVAGSEIENEAMDWCCKHPNDRVAHAILLRLLISSPKHEYVLEAKRALEHDALHKYFRYLFLYELVKIGDTESFATALSLIEGDKEWRTSLKELGGKLLLGLLERLPGDLKVQLLADEWLAIGAHELQDLSEKIARARENG